jgi:8-oxo-dGTP pyrophosphatase MutT (NUDIX family)
MFERMPKKRGEDRASLPIWRYTAAGGVVVDGAHLLVLARPSRGEVRLPKGHIDGGETPAEAALREVGEESGYWGLEVLADLGTQIVEFDYQGQHIIRKEHYFLMTLGERTARQPAENQFEPRWVSWEQALEALSFEGEVEWVRRAMQELAS